MNAQAAATWVEAAESRVVTAEALYKLARDQREAGVATGVDVLRAQVELANEQQRLLEARNTPKQTLLVLARGISLDRETPLELAQPLVYPRESRHGLASSLATGQKVLGWGSPR